ncbi:MAG: 1-acyl-sn-glycerol-3-phosphate acyltransferase [Actinophytocola sp.]|uniref:lysophospholipid acyltransferase family protein n=1 Tax=Actinophytocola sp. TaxID=1872138 RepID=UPI001329DFBA|nr:lysophospholipid acyltransferase family protein [Actinophytocola sp.]MPZ84619.1 1-acyl-sn-glycerol-3-phosphate acyltransferase [Actinophytocola sp.]
MLPDGARPGLHDLARWIARWLYRPAYRIRVLGVSNVPMCGPVVLVANHSTLIEPSVIFGMLPRRSVFLVKSELGRGVLGWGLTRIGQVMVRRGEADRAALTEAVHILKGGGVLGVFPEGTRGSGNVARAEQGAAWLVRATDAVVLPVATRGTLRPPGSGRRFRPKLNVLVGEPFALTVQRGRSGLVEATEEIRRHLADLVRELDEQRSAAVR